MMRKFQFCLLFDSMIVRTDFESLRNDCRNAKVTFSDDVLDVVDVVF